MSSGERERERKRRGGEERRERVRGHDASRLGKRINEEKKKNE